MNPDISMNQYSFTAPARLKVLIVPAYDISNKQFKTYSKFLKSVNEIRLVDLKPAQGIFNPQAYPHGRVVYNFQSFTDRNESILLHDFEPFRKTFGVIGVLQWTDDLTEDQIKKYLKGLKKEYPRMLLSYLFIFDVKKTANISKIPNVAFINSEKDIEPSICDFTTSLLESLSTYVSSYQHVTLRSPGSLGGGIARSQTIEKQKRKISGSFDLTNPISQEKVKIHRLKGRKAKLQANFYLLSGNLKESLNSFCEAIYNLKHCNDFLWLGSALEGLAVTIIILSFLEIPFGLPPAVLTLIENSKDANFSPFSSASPTASPRTSINSLGLNQNQQPVQIQKYPLSSIPRMISQIMEKVIFYYKMSMSQAEDFVPPIVFSECNLRYICLLSSINIEGDFNYSVLSNVVKSTPLSRKEIVNDYDYDNSAILNSLKDIFDPNFKQQTILERIAIYNCLVAIFSSLKLFRKRAFVLKELLDLIITSEFVSLKGSSYREISQLDQTLDILCESYGLLAEPPTKGTLQLQLLEAAYTFHKEAENYKKVIQYGSIFLKYFSSSMSPPEQLMIYKDIKAANSTSEYDCQYWDDELLNSLELSSHDESKRVVEDVLCDVNLTLKNPFAFELEITDMEILCAGSFPLKTIFNPKSFSKNDMHEVSDRIAIILPPNSLTQVSLYVLPCSSGLIEIDGIKATVAGCSNQIYRLYEDSNKVETVTERVKESGFATGSISKETEEKRIVKKISYDVLYKQPRLSLVDVKLQNQWFMLLEGEHNKFQVVLENTSDVEINNLISSCLDSTIEPLNAALNTKKNFVPNEIYEIEYYLIKRPPFKILNKNLDRINKNSRLTLEIETLGKRGMKQATLLLEYSNQRVKEQIDYSRTISIPVNITVYPSIELMGCDVIPLSSNSNIELENHSKGQQCWKFLKSVTKDGKHTITDFCLLSLDLMNSWVDPISIRVQCLLDSSTDPDFQESLTLDEEVPEDTFEEEFTIVNGKTTRLLIPVKRMNLSPEHLARRIPSLRNKQFIVDSKTPEEEQTFIKHAFWYRYELLNRLKACWKLKPIDKSREREGVVDFRGIIFSSRKLESLAIEKIGVKTLVIDSEGEIIDTSKAKLGKFYTVCVTISNRSSEPIFGMLRHIPISLSANPSIDKKILYNGVLQHSIEEHIESGKSKSFSIGIVFLKRDEYEWGVVFDELKGVKSGKASLVRQHIQKDRVYFKVY